MLDSIRNGRREFIWDRAELDEFAYYGVIEWEVQACASDYRNVVTRYNPEVDTGFIEAYKSLCYFTFNGSTADYYDAERYALEGIRAWWRNKHDARIS